MDIFLGRLTSQAMNYAIRSGITITTTYAIKQCSRLLRETTPGSHHREELLQLQLRLESKIGILGPSIDMIELISARGNTTLESTVCLTKSIRADIQRLGIKVAEAAEGESLLRRKADRGSKDSREASERELLSVITSIKALLTKIEDAIPLINLAITTSGINLSTKLSGTISPSRLLQASTFLTAADAKYAVRPGSKQQVGPTWTVSLYMLFTGHANRAVDEGGVREATWKEVIHKTRVKLIRVSFERLYDLESDKVRGRVDGAMHSIPADGEANEFAYQLVIVEDLDDDRVHTFDDEHNQQPQPFEDVLNAGIRDVVPIHEVSKIFYADTGKILNIGGDDGTSNPVLLIKRDVHAEPPRRMLGRSTSRLSNYGYHRAQCKMNGTTLHENNEDDDQSEIDAQLYRESAPNTPQGDGIAVPTRSPQWRLPADLDPEWIAFEVYVEEPDSESDIEESVVSTRPGSSSEDDFIGPNLMSAMSHLKLKSASPLSDGNVLEEPQTSPLHVSLVSKRTGPKIKTSLSLLEMLIKLTALQQFRQDSHLSIEDELLNFFLEDSATAGVGPDKDFRRRLRHDAVRRVGFDPYDESPVKRRGEAYIAHQRGKASPRPEFDIDAFRAQLPNEEADYNEPIQALEVVHPSIENRHSSPQSSPSPHQTEMRQPPMRNSMSPNYSPVTGVHIHDTHQAFLRGSLLATPPSTAKSRQAVLKKPCEPKPDSPLATEFVNQDLAGDSVEERASES